MIDDLRQKYPEFIYENFSLNHLPGKLVINFLFKIGSSIKFSPSVNVLGVDKKIFSSLDKDVIENLAFHLGLIELFSYWKATCSPRIIIKSGYLKENQVKWWQDLIIRGMGQFFYENKINFKKKNFVSFFIENDRSQSKRKANIEGTGLLIPIGGGKDSVLTSQLLGRSSPIAGAFILKSIGVRSNINPSIQIAKKANLKRVVLVKRVFDRKLIELNEKGFLNGHTPYSAYLAFLSVFCGYVFGYRDIAFSNEKSSNEENIKYLNKSINHQYTKTFEFEEKFRDYNKKFLSNINYFSFLRPLYEIQITKIFSRYPKYFEVVKSCNLGVKRTSWNWCCSCPKCLSTFILLYPFLGPKGILDVFPRDLYKDESLFTLLESLISQKKVKPFECVGTKEELKIGLYLSMKKNKKQPVLLAKAWDKYLSKERNWDKRTEEVLNNWDTNNNSSSYFEGILKGTYYE